MAVSANIFERCLTAIGTDIQQCGTAICDVSSIGADALADVFQDADGNWRYMTGLLQHEFGIKACQRQQNGFYDLLIANARNYERRIAKIPLDDGRFMLQPFVLGRRENLINNYYWSVAAGAAGTGHNFGGVVGSGSHWYVRVDSEEGIPNDARWFNPRERVYINGVSAGGSATRTAWEVVASQAQATYIELLLIEQSNPALPAAKTENPVTGLLMRGPANVSDYESWCYEPPGLNVNQNTPFWFETVRHAMCESESWNKFRDLIIDNNPLYREFLDVPDVKRNAQFMADFQRSFVHTVLFGSPLDNQNLNDWFKPLPDGLERFTTTDPTTGIVSSEEGVCVGYKANAVGWYHQLYECGAVKDLQGQVLNLQELFNTLYSIMRVRQARGTPTDIIDILMPSDYAALFQQAMFNYWDNKYGGKVRLNYDISAAPKKGAFGFRFMDHILDYPSVTLRVLTHPAFDDIIAAAQAAGGTTHATASRMILIPDWTASYVGILGSNRVVNRSGDLQARAAVDSTYMCTMKVLSREQSLMSLTHAPVIECAASQLWLENVGAGLPEYRGVSAGSGTDLYGAYP